MLDIMFLGCKNMFLPFLISCDLLQAYKIYKLQLLWTKRMWHIHALKAIVLILELLIIPRELIILLLCAYWITNSLIWSTGRLLYFYTVKISCQRSWSYFSARNVFSENAISCFLSCPHKDIKSDVIDTDLIVQE